VTSVSTIIRDAPRDLPIKDLRFHKMARKIPMPKEQKKAFFADVKANGIKEPIIVQEGGLILDGWHRFLAAKECGLETIPAIVVNLSEKDQLLLIYRMAGMRKHLTDDQRAVLAARTYEVVSGQAKANRASKGGKAGGRGRPKKSDSLQDTSSQEQSETEPAPQSKESTRKQVAALHNVSESKLRTAIKMLKYDHCLLDAVIAGRMKLNEANRKLRRALQRSRKAATAGRQRAEEGAADQQTSEEVEAAYSEPQSGAVQKLLPESTMPRAVEADAQAKEDAADQQLNEEVKAPAELTSSESLPAASQEPLPESAKPPCSGQVERGSTERADTAAGEGDREEAKRLMAVWNAVSKPARKLFLEAALSDPETREMIRGLRVISEANNL
jgi:hypothetical protein